MCLFFADIILAGKECDAVQDLDEIINELSFEFGSDDAKGLRIVNQYAVKRCGTN